MKTPLSSNDKNKSARYFFRVCQLIYLVGFPNFWMGDLFPKTFTAVYNIFSKAMDLALYVFIILEWVGMLTQSSLNEKQKSDRLLFCLSHPLLHSYRLIMAYHGVKIKEMVTTLCLSLKEKVNDEDIEKGMIRKALVFTSSLVVLCSLSLILYGLDAYHHAIKTGGTFTTVIIAWPDTEDKSTAANIARAFAYLAWWVFMSRVFGAYTMMISLIVALEHQYKILAKYFRDLSVIFEKDLSQIEKEMEYNESVKIGIQMHAITQRCISLAQDSFSAIYGGQTLLNTYVLVLIMFQMVSSERNFVNVFVTIATGISMLISTGFIMWSGGDITVEAACLPTDIYLSGWQNCYASGTGTRKMLSLALLQGQRPVVIKGLGVITISYSAYLSIVKSAYSVFSVLY